MAVNKQLLLPSSATQPIVGGDYTKKLKVKVIKLDKLLKGSVAIKKKELNESKREVSEDRKEEIEDKLETKSGKEKEKITKKIKPKMGVFGFIKNFIGNILLGFFAVRLVDQLPKLVAIASVVGKAADFVIDIGGKLFDGLASFIDFGYKVSDGTKNILENIGGENVVGLFEGLIDKVSFVIDALILSTIIGGRNVLDNFGFGPGGFGGRGGKPKLPKLPTLTSKDLKKVKTQGLARGISEQRRLERRSKIRSQQLVKKLVKARLSAKKSTKKRLKFSSSKLSIREILQPTLGEERSSQLKKRYVEKSQQTFNEELIEAGFDVGQGGQPPTPRDKRILRRLTKESDPNVAKSLTNNLSSAKRKRVKTRKIIETIGVEGPFITGTGGSQISAKTFETIAKLAKKGDANSLKKINILLTDPKSSEAKLILRNESDVFRRAARPKPIRIAGAESSGLLKKLKGSKGVIALEGLFAGIEFYDRVQQGQTTSQAASGAVSGAIAGTAGFTAASSVAAKVLSPVLALPIPGARLVYGVSVLGAGVLGSIGLGGFVTGEVDKLTGVEKRNEGGPIRRAPEPVSVKKPKQISSPQPTRFDPDGDKKITENSKLLDKVDYFGPILGLAGKILMGQSPDSQDFRNVSLGLTAFIQRASLLGLVQSLTGYNQGGSVNFMSKLGEDITSWIADTFRSLITKPALDVISFIKEIVVKPFQQLFDGQINDPIKSKSMFDFNMPSPPPLMAPPSISASATSGNVKYDLLEQDPEFAKEVDRLSKKYNINPSHLLGLIASESGFDPKANNETHVGLIQFSKESAKLVGSSQAEILEMSRAQQMKLVEKYFDYWELPKGAGPGQLYMSVFLPSYTNKPSDYVVAKKGEAWYDDNVGLDVNQDGVITPSDLDNRVLKKMEEFGIPAGPSKTEDKKDDSSDVSSSDDKRHPGSITAGKLGKYLYQVLNSPKDFQAVTEHSEFGGVVGRHAEDSYHYSDRAIDIGAYTWEQEKILNAIKKFNEINGVSPVELITGYDDPIGHSDHVHIAYQKGGFVPRNVPAFLHKGEVVVDADSAGPAKNMLLAINQAKDTRGVMEAITQYAPYDVMSGETIVVDRKEIVDNTQPQPEQSPPDIIPVGGSDFFDSLDFVG
jgi:hypothetical protein